MGYIRNMEISCGLVRGRLLYTCIKIPSNLCLFSLKGPNELTVYLPEVLPAVNGRDNPCTKTAWYDFLLPEVAMNTTRDKQAHDQRRRVWEHGFSFKGPRLPSTNLSTNLWLT